MTSLQALIVLRPGVDVDKQLAVCTGRVQQQGYILASLLHASGDWSSAEALVRNGLVDVVVIAYLERDDDLDERIEAAGGRVDAIHRAQHRATVRSMVATLHHSEGWPVQRIAAAFGISPHDVTDHIRRSAVRNRDDLTSRDRSSATVHEDVDRGPHRRRAG